MRLVSSSPFGRHPSRNADVDVPMGGAASTSRSISPSSSIAVANDDDPSQQQHQHLDRLQSGCSEESAERSAGTRPERKRRRRRRRSIAVFREHRDEAKFFCR